MCRRTGQRCVTGFHHNHLLLLHALIDAGQLACLTSSLISGASWKPSVHFVGS